MTEYHRTWNPGATWFSYSEPGRAARDAYPIGLASFQCPCVQAARIYPEDWGSENVPSLAAGE